jgi:dynein heavy chain 2
VTFEAPPGMKKNLIRTYEFWTPEYIAEGTPVRAQLLFALAWFHAVVQERRNYIPQGWSKFYEFSFADLRSGADIINIGTQAGKSPQWEYLHGLLENAIYGGRVDNPFDLRVRPPRQALPSLSRRFTSLHTTIRTKDTIAQYG